jgi:hypothetical protein
MLTHFKGADGEEQIQKIMLEMQKDIKRPTVEIEDTPSKAQDKRKRKRTLKSKRQSTLLDDSPVVTRNAARGKREATRHEQVTEEHKEHRDEDVMPQSVFPSPRTRASSAASSGSLKQRTGQRKQLRKRTDSHHTVGQDTELDDIHKQVSLLVSRTKRGRPKKEDMLGSSELPIDFKSGDSSRCPTPHSNNAPSTSQASHAAFRQHRKRKRRDVELDNEDIEESDLDAEDDSLRKSRRKLHSSGETDQVRNRSEESGSEEDSREKRDEKGDGEKAPELLNLAYVVSAWG